MEASRGAKEGSHTKRGGGGQLCIMQSPQEPRSSHSRVPLRSDGASSPIHRKSVFTLVPCTRTLILPLKPNCHYTQCCVPHPVSSKGEILMIREGLLLGLLNAIANISFSVGVICFLLYFFQHKKKNKLAKIGRCDS